jgi:hypothetical protein
MLKDKFLGFVKLRVGWVIVISICIFGILLIVLELFFGLDKGAEQTAVQKIIAFGGAVGRAALGGGVSGAVLKIMATEGFFLDAVASVAYGPAGLERRTDTERLEIWRNLTRKIYLPFLPVSDGGGFKDSPNSELFSEIEFAVARTFSYDKKFYIDRFHRKMDISWHDKEKKIIRIVDTQDIVLIPFDKEPVLWVAQILTDYGRDISEYDIIEVELKINPPSNSAPVIEEAPQCRTITYKLEGGGKHEIHRRRVWKWCLTKDPLFASISPYVVRNSHVELNNAADDLRVAFKDHGGSGLFVINGGAGKQVDCGQYSSLKGQSLLLPDQGYLLLFVTNAAP